MIEKTVETKNCKNCGIQFDITDIDLKFYDKISPVFDGKKIQIPVPTHCLDCRQQRRLVWRNERSLYRRKCDLCAKSIVSIYDDEVVFPVYCQECWWSDKWNPYAFARDFNFNKTFFEQFKILQNKVPRMALFNKRNENADFTNHCDGVKNGYLTIDAGNSENVFYSKWIVDSSNICDCYQVWNSELCYETLYSKNAYNCKYSILANDCSNSSFLYNCENCQDCFGCFNLINKQYCYYNQQLTKEEYLEKVANIDLGSHVQVQKVYEVFENIIKDVPRKDLQMINCENSVGDFLNNCKNVHSCYEIIDVEDSKYCYDSGRLKDSYDTYEAAFECEKQYDTHACNRCKSTMFSSISYDNFNLMYSDICHNCHDVFGSISLRNAEYCILNKQYSQEEYNQLMPKIIEYMKTTGERGEFFPIELSPFAYNETVAQEFYTLNQQEIEAKGWKRKDIQNNVNIPDGANTIEAKDLPDHIQDVDDDILQKVIICAKTKKPFRIIGPELDFYRRVGISLPRIHPDQRNIDRFEKRNPRKLFDRKCDKCGVDIKTTYSPDREETIYCEKCYEEEVY